MVLGRGVPEPNIQALGPAVSEKKIFSCFSYNNTMADNEAPGAKPILTQGAWLAGFIKRVTKHCFTQNIKALGLTVSEKIFLCFPHYNPTGAICCHGNQSSRPIWPNT